MSIIAICISGDASGLGAASSEIPESSPWASAVLDDMSIEGVEAVEGSLIVDVDWASLASQPQKASPIVRVSHRVCIVISHSMYLPYEALLLI